MAIKYHEVHRNTCTVFHISSKGNEMFMVMGEDIFDETFGKVKKNSATLNFRTFKLALNPIYRIFLNFAKSCVLSCLSNVDNIKKIHRAVFEL